ncbi:hypothetical protein MS3_00002312 [Schistosoma haematobium]|uniref:Uncharacterized protein n=1 Tax=Schistosoma haematobium TaxID=6185 RepID=A0A922LZL7_SCHHA|nr:hypothetical protein MS3_00002312 [Schistosoma haematobium]KAH9596728.1 hypothetical protein MS3_00002312 [Schistosoma haematobium]CAH8489847.1 unnamed protein product [Schistosoma haematobium]CAH8491646.1 unnamed protein product [Schistosoma haematobium]
MEEDPCVVLGSTVSDISDLKKDIVSLGRVLRACDFQNVDDLKDIDEINSFPYKMYCYEEKNEITSCGTIFSDLKSIKSLLSDTSSAFSSYSEQLRTVSSVVNKLSELPKVALSENSCLSSIETEQDFYHLLSTLARGLQSGLFARIRELSTFSLDKCLSEFIDQYNELSIKYNELLVMSSQIPTKQSSSTVLLDQTAVFEMLEREMSNSAKEIEHVRSSFESRLNSITADWECERSKLMTELHKKEVAIEELQQLIEAKEMAYSKVKGDLDELVQQFCSKENTAVGPNMSLNQLRSFLNKLENKCPWIWDLFYGNCNEITSSALPNPIEQKKSLNKIILERNELEDQWHQTKQELLSLRNSHVELTNQLKAKNDELNEMFEKSSKLQQRVSHYRELVNKLCDPRMAVAFADNVRQNLSSNKTDVHCSSSSTIQSTPLTNSSSSMNFNNITPCVQSDQENSLATVSTLVTNKSSSPSSRKSSETSSTSIFSRVGAAVTAIANVITSPKRPQQSPEYSSDNKRSRPSVSVTEPIGLAKSEEKPVLYDAVPNRISHPILSTKSSNFVIPEKPILPSSSSSSSSTAILDNGPMRHHSSTRKPLTELPRSKVKSPTTHKSDHFLSPFSSTPLSKKEYVENCSKPITDFHDFHSEKLNPDFSFLKHGPLAESTSQLPQDVLRSVHANIGKDHQDANRRPSEFIDRPTISQPQNKKDEIFLTPAAPKPLNPSWQISKQEPSKQKPSLEVHNNMNSNELNKVSSCSDQKKRDNIYTNTNSISQKFQKNSSTASVPTSLHRKTSNTITPPQECNPS